MNDRDIRRLARQSGIEVMWRDAAGQQLEVSVPVLRAVLEALGTDKLPEPPPLVTGEQGQPVAVSGAGGRYRLLLEEGDTSEGQIEPGGQLPPIDQAGYHRLQIGGREITLAIAPPRCWTIRDALGDRRGWGLTVQLYSLRRSDAGGIGDFTALADLVRAAGGAGAAAIAISPVHALFSADSGHFSPYAPSSRAMLNVLHGDPGLPVADATQDDALLDWPAASAAHRAAFRRFFETMRDDPAFQEFRAGGGEALERHARFEALHAARFGADPSDWDWRRWPARLRDSDGAGVADFAGQHEDAVTFHAFLQFRADQGLAAAQQAARDAGMAIGLITDVAVGVAGGGSEAWGRPAELLTGLSIGAPPDLFNTAGQNWGVTSFSPHGLVAGGYRAFLDMLRTALRHAGGLRLDHVMGLARLWVIPPGNAAGDGAYLRYPLDDMLRLVRLESQRHRAIVLGEDLGTLPDGFRERLEAEGFAGMRVMWFERDGVRFIPPREWSPGAVAMTSTHDLPTVAGWWSGLDIDWRERLGLGAESRADRDRDRAALWSAFRDSGSADGDPPPPQETGRAVDAAAAHLGTAGCGLALLPLEDALGLPEQPNLPGTIDEHPNWRRRLATPADALLAAPEAAARLDALARTRR